MGGPDQGPRRRGRGASHSSQADASFGQRDPWFRGMITFAISHDGALPEAQQKGRCEVGVKGVPFCFVSSAVFVTSHIQNLRLAAAPGIVRLWNTPGFGGRDPEADAHDRDDQPAHPRSLGDHRRTGFRLNFSVLCRRFYTVPSTGSVLPSSVSKWVTAGLLQSSHTACLHIFALSLSRQDPRTACSWLPSSQ